MKVWKRMCALSLTAAMLTTMLPAVALAAEDEPFSDAELTLMEGSRMVEEPQETPSQSDDWQGVWSDSYVSWQPGALGWKTLEVYKGQLSEVGQILYDAIYAQSKAEYDELSEGESMPTKTHFLINVDNVDEFVIGEDDKTEWEEFGKFVGALPEKGDPRDLSQYASEFNNMSLEQIYDEAYKAHLALESDHPEMPWLHSQSMRVLPYKGIIHKGTEQEQTVLIGFTFYMVDDTPDKIAAIEAVRTKKGIDLFKKGIADAKVGCEKVLDDKGLSVSMAEATDLQKIYAINDYLCRTIDYNMKRSQDPYNQTAYSGLVPHPFPEEGYKGDVMTVCAGYTTAFELLCDIYKVPCISVVGSGDANSRDTNHIWNYVLTSETWAENGTLADWEWHIIDVTWNDGDSDGNSSESYTFSDFLIGKTTYEAGHTPTGIAAGDIAFGFPTNVPEEDYLKSEMEITKITGLEGLQTDYMVGDKPQTDVVTVKALLDDLIEVELVGTVAEETFEKEGADTVELTVTAEEFIFAIKVAVLDQSEKVPSESEKKNLTFDRSVEVSEKRLRLSYDDISGEKTYGAEDENGKTEWSLMPSVENNTVEKEDLRYEYTYSGILPDHLKVSETFASDGEFVFDTKKVAEAFSVKVKVTEMVDGTEATSAEYTIAFPKLTKRTIGVSVGVSDPQQKLYYNTNGEVYYVEDGEKVSVNWNQYFQKSADLDSYYVKKSQLWYKDRDDRNSRWTKFTEDSKPSEPHNYGIYVNITDDDPIYKYTESSAIEIAILKELICSAQDFTKVYDGNPVTPEDCKAEASIAGKWLWYDEAGQNKESGPINVADSGKYYLAFAPDDRDNYETQVILVTITITENSGGSSSGGGGGSASQNVTVPISGEEKSVHADAVVSGDKAVIKDVDMSKLDSVISDDVNVGTVTIDFSTLKQDVSTVEIPAEVVKKIEAAVNDPNNSAKSLEIVLSDGVSIEFDAEALSEKAKQADGEDITVSIKPSKDAKPNSKQAEAIQGRPAYDISVTSGGKHISDMGGKITIHAPYTLQDGEHPNGIVVWYVDDNGNKERCETSYDAAKKRVNWKTDHLSLYMIGYEAPAEDAAESVDNPFTDVSKDMYYFNA
ncbi:MAG: hypothetical protein Q4C06_05165, partial [Bacillota bacterium]|nr:hypothetical protein [Bacillota bacterium]